MPAQHQHFLFYKPYGVLSQFVSNQTTRKNKKKLGDFYNYPQGTMAIGRLDEKSEGLLLLTTDGRVSQEIRSRAVEKEYYVQVDGVITDHALSMLKNGVIISIEGKQYNTLPSKVLRLTPPPLFPERSKKVRDERHGPTSWVSITIREGKFRQVRKMTAAVGFPTLRLVRVRIGMLNLGNLQPGEVLPIATLG